MADIGSERRGGVLVLTPRGRLDNESSADFELLAQESVAAGARHLVVDLAELNYISNAGLRVLGSLAKSLKTPTTSLRLAGAQPAVRQVFDAAGVAMLFEFRPSLEAALADHPAARGSSQLGEHAARLLGVRAGNDAVTTHPQAALLAERAIELFSVGTAAPKARAARAVVEGTQVMRRVTAPVPEPAAAASKGGERIGPKMQRALPAEKKPGLWERLFGKRKR